MWQPIETAPKDGTHILGMDSMQSLGYWNGKNVPVQTVIHYFDDGWHLSVNYDGEHSEFHPTHWRPLDEV